MAYFKALLLKPENSRGSQGPKSGGKARKKSELLTFACKEDSGLTRLRFQTGISEIQF
jgi:hypothetical protein